VPVERLIFRELGEVIKRLHRSEELRTLHHQSPQAQSQKRLEILQPPLFLDEDI
jgi:hypothetical protein